MRLIRTILVLAGAGFFLPSPPEDPALQAAGNEATQVSAVEMLSSATSTFSDVANFCSRQPQTCQTAAYVAAHLEAKAKYSAKLVYEWATEDQTPTGRAIVPVQVGKVDQLQTGSTDVATAQQPEIKGQSTLTIEDLVPAWRGPAPVPSEG